MELEDEVRPPKQDRSRRAWNRVLDAGLAIFEDRGYDGFTITAVCEQADVAPTVIYARTASKETLFLAVYEHGAARVRAEQDVFADPGHWAGMAPAALVRAAVAAVVDVAIRHEKFLRAVVLVSATHPEIHRRGSRYVHELGRRFTGVVLTAATAIRHEDPAAAVWSCFSTVFAAATNRIAYGPDFTTPAPAPHQVFVADLGETAARFLLADPVS